MTARPTRMDDFESLDAELDALVRGHAGFLRETRVRRLGDRLAAEGPLEIRNTRTGFCGDRLSICLDDAILTLKLYWPLKTTLASLDSIRWADDIGWVVAATSTRGAKARLYAWAAQIAPAAGTP